MMTILRTAAVGLLLTATLAACSAPGASSGVVTLQTGGPDATASAAPSASLDPETAQLEFARCMREHGVDVPDPGTGGGPGSGATKLEIRGEGDRQEMEAAMDACSHFLEDAGNFRREADPGMLDRMVEFAGCMRDHGIDMPDPNADGGITFRNDAGDGGSGTFSGDIDPNSPAFKSAEEACRPILGEFAPGGGPGTDSGPEPAKP